MRGLILHNQNWDPYGIGRFYFTGMTKDHFTHESLLEPLILIQRLYQLSKAFDSDFDSDTVCWDWLQAYLLQVGFDANSSRP